MLGDLEDSYQSVFFKGAKQDGIAISKHSLFKLRHIAVIGSMYISPKHRGSGAGKALMTEAISRAKKMKDTEQLHLSVTSTNGHLLKSQRDGAVLCLSSFLPG